jgi:uncharacterized membrane protein YhaH (DUF805 family)
MKKFLTTTGRFPRSVFWGFQLFTLIAFAILGGLQAYMGDRKLPLWPATAFLIFFLLWVFVGVIVQIKRWHDLNKSWIWILVNFIPVFGPLWTLIHCGFIRGTEGENQYGLDPLDNAAV